MKKHLITLLFAVITVGGFAQGESRLFEKEKSQETKSEIITRYRNLLMDNVISNDTAKVKSLLADFSAAVDENYYVTLYTSEKWLISLWLKDYQAISRDVLKTDSATLVKNNRRIQPQDDQLYRIIYQKVVEKKPEITEEIKNNKTLTAEDRNLMLLLLEAYASTVHNVKYTETINGQSTAYITEFPTSPYNDYIRRNIRYEYKPQGFSMGMELYSGAAILTGKTTDYFSSGGIFGCGFIWGYNNFQFNTRAAFVFSGLNHDIDYKGYTWQKGERAQLFLPELSVGYKFMASKKISVSPFAGFAWLSTAPYQADQDKNADLKNIEINSNASPILGIEFGWEFSTMYYYNEFYQKPMSNYYSLNLRYSVQPASFDTKYIGMNGLTHNIAISFKFGFGGAKRIL